MNKLLLGEKPSNKSAVAILDEDKEFYLSIGIPQVDLDGAVYRSMWETTGVEIALDMFAPTIIEADKE